MAFTLTDLLHRRRLGAGFARWNSAGGGRYDRAGGRCAGSTSTAATSDARAGVFVYAVLRTLWREVGLEEIRALHRGAVHDLR
jgi:hypothetical protein